MLILSHTCTDVNANCSLVRPFLCAQALSLWQSILDGPLLRILQQDNSSNPVRASACDCIANIGAEVFDLLPVSGDGGEGGGGGGGAFTDSWNLIRASICDCITNIRAEVFDLLPVSGDWGWGGGGEFYKQL